MIFLALLLRKLILPRSCASSFMSAFARASADLYFWNKPGVTWFTTLSFAWAERMVAMSS